MNFFECFVKVFIVDVDIILLKNCEKNNIKWEYVSFFGVMVIENFWSYLIM